MPKLYEIAEKLPQDAWPELVRKPRYEIKSKPRRRPRKVKQDIVEQREFTDIRLACEHVAEFAHRPTACDRDYRVVAVWKGLNVYQGQKWLFDDGKAFFYITNDGKTSAAQIVTGHANQRCHQENLIEQHKNGVHSLKAPLDSLESNWAYMVIALLAWSLKAWSALLIPVSGRYKERRAKEKRALLRMEFPTFYQAMIQIPAQIIGLLQVGITTACQSLHGRLARAIRKVCVSPDDVPVGVADPLPHNCFGNALGQRVRNEGVPEHGQVATQSQRLQQSFQVLQQSPLADRVIPLRILTGGPEQAAYSGLDIDASSSRLTRDAALKKRTR